MMCAQIAPFGAAQTNSCRETVGAQNGGSHVVMYVLTQIPFDEPQALTVSYGETVGPA
jgi:hypothetical protein